MPRPSFMNTDRRVKSLNRYFTPLGTIPSGEWVGQPVFQYKRANELRMPYRKQGDAATKWGRSEGGILLPNAQYEMGYQIGARAQFWVIARWFAAKEDAATWHEKFGHVIEFPRNGYWFCFQPLVEGYTPNEEWTKFIVSHVLDQIETPLGEHVDQVEKHYGAKEAATTKAMEDMIEDALVDHVPGARGGKVSYPLTAQG